MTRGYVANKKNMSLGQRSRSYFALKLRAQSSVKPVRVRPITLTSKVEFENNLAQIIILTR